MPHNNDSKNEVIRTLDNLREEYETVAAQRLALSKRIQDCINTLDWWKYKDLTDELIERLPKSSYTLLMALSNRKELVSQGIESVSPCDDAVKNKVYQSLEIMRGEHDEIVRQLLAITKHIERCINALDWQNDKDLIEEILDTLPQHIFLRINMYDRLFVLIEEESHTSETPSQDGGGRENV